MRQLSISFAEFQELLGASPKQGALARSLPELETTTLRVLSASSCRVCTGRLAPKTTG